MPPTHLEQVEHRRRRGWWLIGAVLLATAAIPILAVLSVSMAIYRAKRAIAALEAESAIANKEGVVVVAWLPFSLYTEHQSESITIWTSGERVAKVTPLLSRSQRIKALTFTDTPLTAAELSAIAHLHDLEYLALPRTNLNNRELFALLQELTEVRELNVADTLIDDQALDQLALMPNLKSLNIATTPTTLAAVRSLAKLRPDVAIHWRPPLTANEQSCRNALLANGFSVYDEISEPGILEAHQWVIGFPLEALPSEADWQDLEKLGNIVRTHVQGEQYTSDVLNRIDELKQP